jgi:RNA polymerase sigma factor for flagellar operon FliA
MNPQNANRSLAVTQSSGVSPAEREALIVEHVALLKHIVGRMSVPGGMDRDDLYGFGMLGLLAAADSFDPARGHQFSTYAYVRIRGAILDALRQRDVLSRGMRERMRDIERCIHDHEQTHGMTPQPEEIASALELSTEDVDEVLACARQAACASLDDEAAHSRLGSLLCDPRSEDPSDVAEHEELKQRLFEAISGLPEQEKSVITLYYAEGLLLRDIGGIMGVTESRVSQIHSRAIFLLNRTLRGKESEES